MSTPPVSRHRWIRGGTRADRAAQLAALELPGPVPRTVDAHARLRGPYTAVGTLLREFVPDALRRHPDLVRAHDIELLTAAPELRDTVPASRETLTSLAIPNERTRNYPPVRTLRMAHGIAEFLRDHLAATGPAVVVWENTHHADQTDVEVLSVLLRRIDPALLTCVVCTSGDAEPAEPLRTALERHAEPHRFAGATTVVELDADAEELATRYVAGDCVDDDPRLLAGYAAVPAEVRAALHDRRADELEAAGEFGTRLGALPHHRCHGTDPTGAGAQAAAFASDHCFVHGLYHSTAVLAELGLAAIAENPRHPKWWPFTVRIATARAYLGHPDEAEALYLIAQANTENPVHHLHIAYAVAMIHTRLADPERRDHVRAKALVNLAIALTVAVFDDDERAFQQAFMRNGLALVEVHLGQLTEAERITTENIEHLDRVLPPGAHQLHRSVLRYNRSQVYNALGRLPEALADLKVAMTADPHYAEYHFDRANLLRKLGRDEEALAGYAEVMRLSPPFVEAHYNRADLLLGLGDLDGARQDFGYVLELDPDWLDARVNLAGVLVLLDEPAEALRQAEVGLATDPDNPHLHAVRGQVLEGQGEYAAATAAYDRALAADPALVSALAGRASAAYERGDRERALADLTAAVALTPDDPALRFNRAMICRELDRESDAVAELTAALALAPDDADIRAALPQPTP